MIVYYSFFYII